MKWKRRSECTNTPPRGWNVSVPLSIRTEMVRIRKKYHINWSSIGAAAFAKVISEIQEQEKEEEKADES